MKHKKQQHCDKVAICWKFAHGICNYEDTECWFLHCQTANDTESAKVKCYSCDKEFNCQPDLFRHCKKQHSHQVSKCKHGNYGKCIFGSKNCSFIHEKYGNIPQSENSDEEV